MGFKFGVQPPETEDGIEYHCLRVGSEEIEGKPGVMSQAKASGDAGKERIKARLLKVVEEFT